MHRPTAFRVIGGLALAATVILPWPDGALLAALGPAPRLAGLSPDAGSGLPLLLAVGALLLLLPILLSGRGRRDAAGQMPVRGRAAEPILRRAVSPEARDGLSWHLLGSVIDHVSDLRLHGDTGRAGAPPPVPHRAQALLRFVAQPGDALRSPSPDFRRQTSALLHQLRD